MALVVTFGAAAAAAAVVFIAVVTVHNASFLLFIVVATAALVYIVTFLTILNAITVSVVVTKESASHRLQLSLHLDFLYSSKRYIFR